MGGVLGSEEVLYLRFECLDAPVYVVRRPNSISMRRLSYESRLAELSRRRAGLKTHCFPNRAHLVASAQLPLLSTCRLANLSHMSVR